MTTTAEENTLSITEEPVIPKPQFCTTAPHSFLALQDAAVNKMTAPASAMGERKTGWLPGRGHQLPCEPSFSGFIDGDVEHEAGFDIPTFCNGELLVDCESHLEIECEVWVNPKKKVDCLMIVWPTNRFVCWKGNSGWSYDSLELAHTRHGNLPDVKFNQEFRFYIVSKEDEKALERARIAAFARKTML